MKRCPKCSYLNSDYSSKCEACNEDLTNTKNTLKKDTMKYASTEENNPKSSKQYLKITEYVTLIVLMVLVFYTVFSFLKYHKIDIEILIILILAGTILTLISEIGNLREKINELEKKINT